MKRTRVIVNGTFDVLHPGHVHLLEYAKSLGSHLLVAIDADDRVRELKGVGRPFFSQEDRKLMLQSLSVVDHVVIFDSADDLENIIREYRPEVMVKGGDYRGKPIVGEHLVPVVEFFDRINEYSSTKAIQHLTSR